MQEYALRRLHRRAKESPRFPLVISTLLVMAAFGLGWVICSTWTREIYVGIGPPNTTFRRIAMEAAATMSNTLKGVRVVYCDTSGTADALEKLERSRMPLFGRFTNRDCKTHLDLAIVTDGTQHPTTSTTQVVAPLYTSYLQIYTRDDIYKTLPTRDVAGLLSVSRRINLGIAPRDQATYDRACALFGRLSQGQGRDCMAHGFNTLGFRAEINQARPRDLVALLQNQSVDAIVVGGPPCPEGTQSFATAGRPIHPLGVSGARGFTVKPIAYPCLAGQTADTPETWTYLAMRDDVPLSFAEIENMLSAFGSRLPDYVPDLEFAPFTDPSAWTTDIRATGLGLKWLDGYRNWLSGGRSNGIRLFEWTSKIITLLGAIVGLILGVRNVTNAMRPKTA